MYQIFRSTYHITIACPWIRYLKTKSGKCGRPYKMELYGLRCGYCSSTWHIKDICWKCGKDGKTPFVANNYLEVLIDDEETTLEQLNRLCNMKHGVFSGTMIPRRHLCTKTTMGK
jgi:hypothetical protein